MIFRYKTQVLNKFNFSFVWSKVKVFQYFLYKIISERERYTLNNYKLKKAYKLILLKNKYTTKIKIYLKFMMVPGDNISTTKLSINIKCSHFRFKTISQFFSCFEIPN